MTEKQLRIRLNGLFTQLHYSVIYEKEILQDTTQRGIYDLRDKILDEIIFIQRQLGIRK
jgi:hypothetical protein